MHSENQNTCPGRRWGCAAAGRRFIVISQAEVAAVLRTSPPTARDCALSSVRGQRIVYFVFVLCGVSLCPAAVLRAQGAATPAAARPVVRESAAGIAPETAANPAIESPGVPAGDESPAVEVLPQLLAPSTRFGSFDLVLLDAAGVEQGPPPLDVQGMLEPAWSPDGSRVAFVSYRTGTSQIWVMQADGTGLVNLTRTTSFERNPAWSPDGTRIAFTSNRTGDWDVWVMQADGSQPVNLSKHPAYDADPAWSPDGRTLLFASNRSGAFRVWQMQADGSQPRDVLGRDLAGYVYPAWSPNGRQFLFANRSDQGGIQLFVARLDGAAVEQLTMQGQICSWAAWSPDGRYIAYVRFDEPLPNTEPGSVPDSSLPGGTLMIYDAFEDTHTPVSAGDMPAWGPRPAWKPLVQ